MIDPNSHLRFSKNCTEAAIGYATAAAAGYAEIASKSMQFWAETVQAMVPEPEPRSWYRRPGPPPYTPERTPAAGMAMMNFGFPWTPAAPATPQWPVWPVNPWAPSVIGEFQPFAAWLNLWPLRGTPAAWPMAYMMMGYGIPRSVAWPTAEANAAALEATQAATASVEQAFSSYRSDGGHALAQIKYAPFALFAAAMLPFTADAVLLSLRTAQVS